MLSARLRSAGSDGLAFNGAIKFRWQIWRGADPHVNAIGVEQQHRADHVARLAFEETEQCVECPVQRHTLRDHFKQLLLAVNERLRLFAASDVMGAS